MISKISRSGSHLIQFQLFLRPPAGKQIPYDFQDFLGHRQENRFPGFPRSRAAGNTLTSSKVFSGLRQENRLPMISKIFLGNGRKMISMISKISRSGSHLIQFQLFLRPPAGKQIPYDFQDFLGHRQENRFPGFPRSRVAGGISINTPPHHAGAPVSPPPSDGPPCR